MPEVIVASNPCGVPTRLRVGDSTHEGGEGSVHFSLDGRYAVKIYHSDKVSRDKRHLLEMVVALGHGRTDADDSFFCWPLALVDSVDGMPAVGCVTERIPTPPFVQLKNVNQSARTAATWFKTGLDWSHLLQLARGVGRSVAVLHGRGCAHADLSFYNFLVNPNRESCDVVLIDLDGVVVSGFLQPQVKGTMGIIAPEVLSRDAEPGELSDRHSLAVQILQTLLLRNPLQPLITYDPEDERRDEIIGWGPRAVFSEHPTDRRHRPRRLGLPLFKRGALSYRMLSPALQRLTERALIESLHHPTRRPAGREWIRALSWCLDELYQCPRCRLHFPYPHWNPRPGTRRCPFCGYAVNSSGYGVLWLYEPSRGGQYSLLQRHVVLAPGWSLFSDVVTRQTDPPMSRRRSHVSPVGHVEHDRDGMASRLVSDDGVAWTTQAGGSAPLRRVSRGQSVRLEPGTIIRFGDDRRVMVVKE